jgi:hypothetical protein
MINGIAEELFFHDNEFNYYEADSLRWYEEWAKVHNDAYEVGRQKGVDHSNWFVSQHFMPSTLVCNSGGCKNMVSVFLCPMLATFETFF